MESLHLQKCFASIKSFAWKYEGHYDGFEVFVITRSFQNKELRFLLGFDGDFPDSLPLIYLLKTGERLENIPHLMTTRQVCYLDPEGVICDADNPIGIIEESVALAFHTIIRSMTGASDEDYLREFDYHWHQIQKARAVTSLVGDLKGAQLVLQAYWKYRQIIGQSLEQIEKYADRVGVGMGQATIAKMLYIPLTTANGIQFKQVWDLSDLRRIIFSNIGFKNRVEEFLASNPNLPVYLTVPGSEANRLHLAAAFENSRSRLHPLLDKKQNGSFYALSANRMDMAYLLPRGGVRDTLFGKKVVVIGCGAIGGLIVQELAKAGIMNLLLIDPDILSHNNLYRHLLGMSNIGQYKVDALKNKLEKDLPHVNIMAIPSSFTEAKHRQQQIDFTQYDLVIDATAVVPVSNSIAKFFIHNHPGLPVLHTWLEALGIGGHAMVTNQGGAGCYKCLYSVRDPEYGIYNRASFAAKGQIFSKAMFGCAGRFTPFSSLDAYKTAGLAVELALKVLSGQEKRHPLLSWKGDSKHFLEAGYMLSDRYKNLTEQGYYEQRYDYVHQNCSLCVKTPV